SASTPAAPRPAWRRARGSRRFAVCSTRWARAASLFLRSALVAVVAPPQPRFELLVPPVELLASTGELRELVAQLPHRCVRRQVDAQDADQSHELAAGVARGLHLKVVGAAPPADGHGQAAPGGLPGLQDAALERDDVPRF